MLNISPIGRNCSQTERDDFEVNDVYFFYYSHACPADNVPFSTTIAYPYRRTVLDAPELLLYSIGQKYDEVTACLTPRCVSSLS
jgi:hypothetical protein